jgi:hypothetical protein
MRQIRHQSEGAINWIALAVNGIPPINVKEAADTTNVHCQSSTADAGMPLKEPTAAGDSGQLWLTVKQVRLLAMTDRGSPRMNIPLPPPPGSPDKGKAFVGLENVSGKEPVGRQYQ